MHQSLSLVFPDRLPVASLFLHLLKTEVDGIVKEIPDVHSSQLILLALCQLQTVIQEMGIGTGRVLFQPRDTAAQHRAVQRLRRHFPDSTLFIGVKCRIYQSFYVLSLLLIHHKMAEQLQEFRILPGHLEVPKAVGQPSPGFPDGERHAGRFIRCGHDGQLRKQLS